MEVSLPEGNELGGEAVINVLQSILLEGAEEGETLVKEDGSYKLALLAGQAPKEAVARFIGSEARKRYRLEMIEKLAGELADLREIRLGLSSGQQELKNRQQSLNRERDSFPVVDDVKTAYVSWEGHLVQGEMLKEEIEIKNGKVKKILELIQFIQEDLRVLVKDMTLPIKKGSYELALGQMESYQKSLHELELNHVHYQNVSQNLINYKLALEDAIFRVDELKGELNLIINEIKKLELQIKNAEERLSLLGVEEVRERIKEVSQKIKEFPQELSNCEHQLTTHQNHIKTATARLESLGAKEKAYQGLSGYWASILREEFKLGLVKEAAEIDAGEDFLKIARAIKSKLTVKEGITRDRLFERLSQSFFEERGTLVEYRLTQEPIGEVSVELADVNLGEDGQIIGFLIDELRVKAHRIQILLEYSGQKVSPFFVLAKLEGDIELQKSILDESDRELYEEIIMNSVGKIIRGRIFRAEAWVNKIDGLMAERDTSSGLTFSLRWRPLTAELEEELDTKELVDLLRLDPKFLKTGDMDRITQHFRSKIARAKELMEEKGYGETFNQVIKEMLDYRKWFQFNLYYQRAGERKRELTNNVFYTFSGGEKAMAMYIPLFSAAYSRYQEAGKDAPYIISLDEAFAGVDENNIRDMFDLVEKLGFNYIMNSQSLWGDYDTVSALSISELVRPPNASYVTVVRYLWNGRQKELLLSTQMA